MGVCSIPSCLLTLECVHTVSKPQGEFVVFWCILDVTFLEICIPPITKLSPFSPKHKIHMLLLSQIPTPHRPTSITCHPREETPEHLPWHFIKGDRKNSCITTLPFFWVLGHSPLNSIPKHALPKGRDRHNSHWEV